MITGIRDARTPTQIKSAFPSVTLGRVFTQSDTPIAAQSIITSVNFYCQPYWDESLVPIVSFNPLNSDVASGAWTPYLRELAEHLKTKPTTKVVVRHEPEGKMTGKEFGAMFTRVRSIMKDTYPTLQIGASYMIYHWLPSPSNPNLSIAGNTDNPTEWWVDADFYAADVYSGRSVALNLTLPEHPGFARWLSLLVHSTDNFAITERGFETALRDGSGNLVVDGGGHYIDDPTLHATRVTTIGREADWLLTPTGQRCVFYTYWNTSGAEASPALVLDATGETALNSLFTRVVT